MSGTVRDLTAEELELEMGRRELVFERPTRFWQSGLSVGNGDLQGSVFGGGAETEGAIAVALSKVDVWDERYDRKGHRYHTLAELRALVAEHAGSEEGRRKLDSLEPYGLIGKEGWTRRSYPYPYAPPTPKPSGLLRVDPGAILLPFEERLSMHRGEVTFSLGDDGRGVSASVFVDAATNVAVAHVERHGSFDHSIQVSLSRYVDDQLGEPEVGGAEGELWHRYVFPDGSAYAVWGVAAEGDVRSIETSEGEWRDIEARTSWEPGGYMRIHQVELRMRELRVTARMQPEVSSVTLYLGAATSREVGDPLSRARDLARAAARRGLERIRHKHLLWWDAFWRRSSLVMSDRLVETLWYHGLYLLACQSRGPTLPSLVGPGYQLPFAGWGGTLLTNYNLQMTYWPVFISNHLELGEPLWDFFLRRIELMKAEARELCGIEGVRIPCTFGPEGREISYLPCRLWQSVGGYTTELYWWRYLYSQDLEFLRDVAYPLMRGVAEYYRGYAQEGADGFYHIFPSTPPEQPPWWATDPAIDMAVIRVILDATLRASELLGADETLRPGWRDLLDRLAPIPTNGGVILDHRDAPPDSRLGHTGLLCCVFSSGLIGLSSSAAEQELAKRTLATLPARTSRKVLDYPFPIPTWNDDCNWPSMIGYAARLGMGEDARRYLYDFGLFQHLKPNGLFAFDCPLDEKMRETRWGMPDSSYAMTAMVSEMLLSSYEGFIRLFPAVPLDWSVRISGFLAIGAFEVDAAVAGGVVSCLAIRSLKGLRCRIRNPWPGAPVQVSRDGREVTATERDGVMEFDTEPGGYYVIASPGRAAPEIAHSAEGPARPIGYLGPSHMGSVAEKDRVTVWLGLPK